MINKDYKKNFWRWILKYDIIFPDLQKASGIRVLRHTLERQKSVESTEALILRHFQEHNDNTISHNNSVKSTSNDTGSVLSIEPHHRKKPPARLKPLVNHSRQGSVVRVIDNSDHDIPAIVMNGSSLVQNVAFSTDFDAYDDKSVWQLSENV